MDANDVSNKNRRGESALALMVCVVFAFVVYYSALGNAFFNDDSAFLLDGRRLAAEPSILLKLRPLNYFRPVWSAYVGVLEAILQLQPMGYFVCGVAMHGLIGFLVWNLALMLQIGRAGSWFAALSFVAFFSQAEATLWMASHNSSMAAGFCILAVLCHLKAVERGGALRAALTGFVVLLALFTKETAITVLAWLPIAQCARFGWRSIFTKASAVRFAAAAAALVALLIFNERFIAGLQGQTGGPNSRAGFENLSISRIIGAIPILYSPVGTRPGDTFFVLGIVAVAILILLAIVSDSPRRRALFAAAALGLAALVPASTTTNQHHASSRLYYFPTVGAALSIGVLAAWMWKRRAAGAIFTIVWICYIVAGVVNIYYLNEKYYKPFSWLETRSARTVGGFLNPNNPAIIYWIDPPIDNISHLQNFLMLFHGVPYEAVEREHAPVATFDRWIAERKLEPGAIVIGTAPDGTAIEISAAPPETKPPIEGGLRIEAREQTREDLPVYIVRWRPPVR